MTATITAPTTVTCYDCAEDVVSTSRDGWAGMTHASGRTDHGVRVASYGTPEPTRTRTRARRIVDHGGHLAVYVDRGHGAWSLIGTTPTRWRAQVPAARERGYAEALVIARRWARNDDAPVIPVADLPYWD